jgi:NAD(P)-dependent dehydrogenase (short-subunit alcohol dehydrogenase family)
MAMKTKGGKEANDAARGSNPQEDVRGTKGGVEAQKSSWPGQTAEMRPTPDHGESTYKGSGKLTGKTALITGGDSGIGRAVAIAMAREGADIAIAYLNEHEDAKETAGWVEKAGRRAITIARDLQHAESCRQIVEETVERLGKLDILVNNAAYQWELADIEALTSQQLERTFRTNIFAYILVAQAALRHMGSGSVIINTGSVTALSGQPSLIDYSATKGAIHTFTKSLAQAVAERGIRVNCVAPGPVWTPLITATLVEKHVERFGQNTFWERPAQPSEIAPSYVFLSSDDSRYYTGGVLSPTGRTETAR